jgi:hypothetical protein
LAPDAKQGLSLTHMTQIAKSECSYPHNNIHGPSGHYSCLRPLLVQRRPNSVPSLLKEPS